MSITKYLALSVILTLLSACGPTLQPPAVSSHLLEQEARLQRELLFKTSVDRSARLQRIYTPLRIANADLCGSNISSVTGISGVDRQSISVELRPAAQRLYGVSDGVTVIDVVPGSPAAQAGLEARDVVTGAANGTGVTPSGWTWSGLTIADLVKVIEKSAGNPITLLIRRGGNIFPIVVDPKLGCRYPIHLIHGDVFNAGSDGSQIFVFTGLFNHVPDDREIAVIVGHELAHNILRHREKKEGNQAIGGAAGLVFDIGLAALGVNTQGVFSQAGMQVGVKAYSQEFEFEADYLGLYMLARTGFDIDVAPDLYRRMGVQDPSSQVKNYAATHPSTPERSVAMTQTIAEIRGKMNQQEALLPKNLEGQALAVNRNIQTPAAPVVALAQAPTAISAMSGATAMSQLAPAAAPPAPQVTASANATSLAPASTANTGQRLLAQLYLIKGRIVTNPPQAFSAEFLEEGKASVVLAGRRLLTGNHVLFELGESISAKYTAKLLKPDTLKPFSGADAKGFAALSDVDLEIECVYGLTRSTGRGDGTCADNQGNTYRISF
jgi:S1-C subfamily serine protease